LKDRDLDNRNKKYVFDAIRDTGVLHDDTWQDISMMDIGFFDEHSNHLQVFVLPENVFPAFIQQLKNHPVPYINNKRFSGQVDEFESS